MGARPMRIILKPYGLRGQKDSMGEGQAYWRATTDFPATKNGKACYGRGLDKMSALAACLRYCSQDVKSACAHLTEANMYPMPDQKGFTFWQLNLDGSKPTREEWMADRQFYNTFGHLPFNN